MEEGVNIRHMYVLGLITLCLATSTNVSCERLISTPLTESNVRGAGVGDNKELSYATFEKQNEAVPNMEHSVELVGQEPSNSIKHEKEERYSDQRGTWHQDHKTNIRNGNSQNLNHRIAGHKRRHSNVQLGGISTRINKPLRPHEHVQLNGKIIAASNNIKSDCNTCYNPCQDQPQINTDTNNGPCEDSQSCNDEPLPEMPDCEDTVSDPVPIPGPGDESGQSDTEAGQSNIEIVIPTTLGPVDNVDDVGVEARVLVIGVVCAIVLLILIAMIILCIKLAYIRRTHKNVSLGEEGYTTVNWLGDDGNDPKQPPTMIRPAKSKTSTPKTPVDRPTTAIVTPKSVSDKRTAKRTPNTVPSYSLSNANDGVRNQIAKAVVENVIKASIGKLNEYVSNTNSNKEARGLSSDKLLKDNAIKMTVAKASEPDTGRHADKKTLNSETKKEGSKLIPLDEKAGRSFQRVKAMTARPWSTIAEAKGSHRQESTSPITQAKGSHRQESTTPIVQAKGSHRQDSTTPIVPAEGSHRQKSTTPTVQAKGSHRQESTKPTIYDNNLDPTIDRRQHNISDEEVDFGIDPYFNYTKTVGEVDHIKTQVQLQRSSTRVKGRYLSGRYESTPESRRNIIPNINSIEPRRDRNEVKRQQFEEIHYKQKYNESSSSDTQKYSEPYSSDGIDLKPYMSVPEPEARRNDESEVSSDSSYPDRVLKSVQEVVSGSSYKFSSAEGIQGNNNNAIAYFKKNAEAWNNGSAARIANYKEIKRIYSQKLDSDDENPDLLEQRARVLEQTKPCDSRASVRTLYHFDMTSYQNVNYLYNDSAESSVISSLASARSSNILLDNFDSFNNMNNSSSNRPGFQLTASYDFVEPNFSNELGSGVPKAGDISKEKEADSFDIVNKKTDDAVIGMPDEGDAYDNFHNDDVNRMSRLKC